MFAAGKTAAVSGETPDAQFNYVTMLLHGDGTNGAQNNTFLDSSTNNFTITRNGNTTQGSFSPYGSNWSNYFDGSGDWLRLNGQTEFAFGTGDFTIEGWFNASDVSTTMTLYDSRPTSTSGSYPTIIIQTQLKYFTDSNTLNISGSTTIQAGVWYHFAVVRNSTTTTLYLNGVSEGSASDSYNYLNGSQRPTIGTQGFGTANQNYNGYLSNVRVVKGSAVYTSNFTPSTTPLTAITNTSLLTCQSNRFIDNSTNAFAITVNGNTSVQRFNPFGASTAYSTSVIGGSGYFDGSGDYLTAPDNTALDLSGDFTVEAWVNVDNVSSEYCVFHNHTSNTNGIALTVNSGAPRLLSGNGSWQVTLDSSITIKPNTWNHIAGTRSGNTYTIWVNGVSGGTASNSSTPTYSGGAQIGRLTSGVPIAYIGYMSNLRVVKGTAVYTTTFTPSTTPLTAISGTSLLLEMTNGAIFDNAMMNDLETVGNAQISTSVVKFGTGSLAFDGTGDWLTVPYGPTQNFGTGAFTIEMWAYLNSLSASYYVPAGTWGSGTSDEWLIQIQNNGNIRFLTTAGSTFYSASITTATWYHIAVVRNGSTINIYVNGTSVGSYTCSNSLGSVSKTLYIGSQAGTWDWNGYIDDFRITNGYARYTANFTSPTAAFPNIGPT